ncbi:MAG: Ig-like domain-containing protein [Thaumarchaeota archaeon]|nr:Ig-like domain-containing protein [Nitrososphaerota archaeon]
MTKTRHLVFGVLLAIIILTSIQSATAFSSYLTTFNTKYGTSSTRLNTCGLCHIDPAGGGPRNSYGQAFENQTIHRTNPAQAYTNIESLDSDGDGYTNIAEILARTFPGDASDHPAPTPVLTTITVTPATASLTVGGTQTFTAAAKDQNGNPMSVTITWSSSNTAVGTINSAGVFTALAAGSATVSATSGTVSGTASVTVTNPPPVLTTITVTPSTASLTVGGTQTFTATAKDQYGNPFTTTVTWSSSNTAAGTVNSAGVFTALSAGSATVSATSGTVSGSASVTVTAPAPVLTTITVSPSTASLVVGGNQQFTAATKDQNGNPISATVTWSSSNTSVGTVDSTGKFTALAAGSATVTATSGTVSGTASVTVTAPAPTPVLTTITVTPSTASLTVGGTQTFTATTLDQFGNPISAAVTWSSSNTTVGTIDSTGKFTALAAGSATVTASSGAVQGSAAVTVTAPIPPPPTPVLTTITVSPATASLVVGGTQTFTATAKDQNGNPMTVTITWSSSNATVGTVDATGKFTALAAGTTTVIAASGSVNGTASVTVTAPVVSPPPPPPSSNQTYTVTFVIVDASTGKPVHEAKVTLDGVTKETNRYGQVTFTNVTAGSHTYKVTGDDDDGRYQQISSTINVTGNTTIQVKLTPIGEHESEHRDD